MNETGTMPPSSLKREAPVWAASLVVIGWALFSTWALPIAPFDDWRDLVRFAERRNGQGSYLDVPALMNPYIRVLFSEQEGDFALGRRRLAGYLIAEGHATPARRTWVEAKLDWLVSRRKQVDLFANLVQTSESKSLWEFAEKYAGLPLSALDENRFLYMMAAIYYEGGEKDYLMHSKLGEDLRRKLERRLMWPPPPSWTQNAGGL